MPSAHGPCFVQTPRKSRSEDPTFSRTEVSAHGPIICCNQLRENIGAIFNRSKSPISNATLIDVLYDRLDYETHATDKTMRYL